MNKKFNEWFDGIEDPYRPIVFVLFLFSWMVPNIIAIGLADNTTKQIDMTKWYNEVLLSTGAVLLFVAIAFAVSRMIYVEEAAEGKE